MNNVWVLVCDASRGRLFEIPEPAGDWNQIEVFDHEGSTDHDGVARASDAKEVEKKHFAHTLASMLDQAQRSNRFRALVLVSPPHFLGMLKAELTAELTKHLIGTLDKDLTHESQAQLVERLAETVLLPVDQRTVLQQSHNHPH